MKEKIKKWEDTTPEEITSEENWEEGWEIVDERSAVEMQDLGYLEEMEVKYEFECPNPKCRTPLELNVSQEYPSTFKTFCPVCYTPLLLDRESNEVKMIVEPIRCSAFFSHSTELEDEKIVEFVEGFLRLWGVEPKLLQIYPGASTVETIKQMIKETDITFVVITKRYICEGDRQFVWKASEWIQNEIGIAYAYGKPVLALVERGVNIRGILPQITWYYEFERSRMNSPAIPVEFFNRLENTIDYVEEEKRRREARANAILTLALPLIAAGAGAFLGAILGGAVTKR